MKAYVLAAGEGSRLKPITDTIPKCLLPINGIPVIAHNLVLLHQARVERVIINTYHLSDQVIDYIGSGKQFKLEVEFFQQKKLRGTAGDFRMMVRSGIPERMIIMCGDNYTNIDLNAMISYHMRNHSQATIALFNKTVHRNSGIYGSSVTMENTCVTSFREGASDSNLVNAGIYIFDYPVILEFPSGENLDFGKDVFPVLLKKLCVGGYVMKSHEFCFGIDTPECYERIKTNDYYKNAL